MKTSDYDPVPMLQGEQRSFVGVFRSVVDGKRRNAGGSVLLSDKEAVARIRYARKADVPF